MKNFSDETEILPLLACIAARAITLPYATWGTERMFVFGFLFYMFGRTDSYGLLKMDRSASPIANLKEVADPRHGEPVYLLENVLFTTICVVISDADNYEEVSPGANTGFGIQLTPVADAGADF